MASLQLSFLTTTEAPVDHRLSEDYLMRLLMSAFLLQMRISPSSRSWTSIEMLAFLESVETQEENKRTFALHRKRFEARRQDGLTGKPHQVSESRVLESRKKQFKGTELEKFHLWASTKGTHDNHVAPRSPPHHHKTSKQAYRNLHQPKGSRS